MELSDIYGCPCYAFKNYEEAYNLVEQFVNKGGYSAAINAEKIIKFEKDKEINKLLSEATIPIPDGVGAVYGMRILHGIKSIRLDLPGLVLNLAENNKLKMFLLGASEESNLQASLEIAKQYPHIKIVGRLNGFFKSLDEVRDKIEKSQPEVVLLALGSPKQEFIARDLLASFPDILFIGCGGRFDILSGKVKRAPIIWQKLGLEWLYRLSSQPSRFKRQKAIPALAKKLLKSYFKKQCIN